MRHLIFLIGILAIAGVVWWVVEVASPSAGQTITETRITMEEDIETRGAAEAYLAFKEHYQNVPFDTQHSAAHLFGESLYSVLGLPGIAVCDTNFSFGCYHGFFTQAVSENGLGVVGALDQACSTAGTMQSASACQHGIGHGILEYLGSAQLSRALEACVSTNQPNPLAGCTSGVFMEYNVPLSVRDDGTFSVMARPLTSVTEPYYPCPEVAKEFQASCYHELPQWWKQVYGGGIAQMGMFCKEVTSPVLTDACYDGIGNIVASSGAYDTARIVQLCTELTDTTRRDECVVAGAWSLWVSFRDASAVATLCSAVSASARTQCPSIE